MSESPLEPSGDPPKSPQTGDDGFHGQSFSDLRANSADELTGQAGIEHAATTSSTTNMAFPPFDENIFDSTPPQGQNENDTPSQTLPATEEPIHPPDFKPFFTLIEDPETGAFHHPRVHYIFSDDDPEILTTAVLDTFEESTEHEFQGEQPLRSSNQRSMILDVAADGKTVTSAASLSPEWQGLQTSISAAPSWGNESNGAERGLMLKISGQQSLAAHGASSGMQRQGQNGSVEEMLEMFGRRLASLDSALGRSE